jgi:hypothetical protein
LFAGVDDALSPISNSSFETPAATLALLWRSVLLSYSTVEHEPSSAVRHATAVDPDSKIKPARTKRKNIRTIHEETPARGVIARDTEEKGKAWRP